MTTNPSQIINPENPLTNIHGCLPCPKCNSKNRTPHKADLPDGDAQVIICNNCGFSEDGYERDE